MQLIAFLFDVKHAIISGHITNILAFGELDETSVGFPTKVQEEDTNGFISLDNK